MRYIEMAAMKRFGGVEGGMTVAGITDQEKMQRRPGVGNG